MESLPGHTDAIDKREVLRITREDIDSATPLLIKPPPLVITPQDIEKATPFSHKNPRELERRMLGLINADRSLVGESPEAQQPLEWNDQLAETSRRHSRAMVNKQFVDHVGPDGSTPEKRLREAGIIVLRAGENIAFGHLTVEMAERDLMKSPGHRANILDSQFTHVGIGVMFTSDGRLAITQNFATLPKSYLRRLMGLERSYTRRLAKP